MLKSKRLSECIKKEKRSLIDLSLNMRNEWKNLKSLSKRCNLRNNSKLLKFWPSLTKSKNRSRRNNSNCLRNVRKILRARTKRLKRQLQKLSSLKWKDSKPIDKACNYTTSDLRNSKWRTKKSENRKKSYFRNGLKSLKKRLRKLNKRKKWRRKHLIPSYQRKIRRRKSCWVKESLSSNWSFKWTG